MVLEWICDMGENQQGNAFHYCVNRLFDYLCLDHWWSPSEAIVYRISEDKKVYKTNCLQKDGCMIFLK